MKYFSFTTFPSGECFALTAVECGFIRHVGLFGRNKIAMKPEKKTLQRFDLVLLLPSATFKNCD